MNDEFYIGWEEKTAPGIRRSVRNVVGLLIAIVIGLSVVLAAAQQMIGNSVFEWGVKKTFYGVLRVAPYPCLYVLRPGAQQREDAGPEEPSAFSTYQLVAPWKFGLDRMALAQLDGAFVKLEGTLIFRDERTMIETRPEWITPATPSGSDTLALPGVTKLGQRTLHGEIVDSKCYFGVMNPGQLIPHRACAIRCISGGVPPVLLVRSTTGPATYYVLVSAEGKPVNKEVLELVALPVEITGEVEQHGDLLILRADPTAYRRVEVR